MMCLILSIREKSGNQKTKNVDCQVRVGATWSCQRGPSCSKTVYRLPEFKSTPRFLFVLLKKKPFPLLILSLVCQRTEAKV